ncbi:MAG: Outer membrane protein assembly factor BamE [Burkholderia gladioli]|nr:MAG: Outer membrane protein assembly factor BamE [Burkholderia gladioli]
MQSTITAAFAVAVVTLAGCSFYDSVTQRIAQSITPYRITVVQGNFVSQEKAFQLQAGMTRVQVRALLGTPLLGDMFHANRWDYLFYFKRGLTSVVQQRDLVVHFQNDRLAHWSGADNLPSELDLLADIDGDRHGKKKAKATAPASTGVTSFSSAAAVPSSTLVPRDLAPDAAVSASQVGQSDANIKTARAANRTTAQGDIEPGLAGQPLPLLLADCADRSVAGRHAVWSEPDDPDAVPVPPSAAAYRAERRKPAGCRHP